MKNPFRNVLNQVLNKHRNSSGRQLRKMTAMMCVVAVTAANLQLSSAVTVVNAAETEAEAEAPAKAEERVPEPAAEAPSPEKTEEVQPDSGQSASGAEEEVPAPADNTDSEVASDASPEKPEEAASDAPEDKAEPASEITEDGEASDSPSEEGADPAEDADAGEEENTADPAEEETAEEPAEESMEESIPVAGKLKVKGKGYTVTVTFTEEAGLPEGTVLLVKEITGPDSSAYEDRSADAMNVDGARIAQARFFDISFEDKKGRPLEPSSGISVRIVLDKAPADVSDVQVVHFDDENPEDDETVSARVRKDTDIRFTAESFSVYGVVYTVDFTYGGYTYRMDGGGSVLLSALARELGLYEKDYDRDFEIGNVSSVTFTDHDLIRVSRQADGDWLLTSLASFEGGEILTVTMEDGVKFEITVTDPPSPDHYTTDLASLMTDAAIVAPRNEDGAYIVEPGTPYTISLSFKEQPDKQFSNSETMTYPIPAGLNADGHSGTFTVIIERGGQKYPVAGNTYSIENGVLTVTWNQANPNFNQLKAAANVRFTLNFDGTFDESAEQIRFTDSIVKDLEIDTSTSVTTSKTGTVDLVNDRIYYTAAVSSHGTSSNVVLTDTITGDGLTLDPSSIQATSSTGDPVSMTGTAEGNSFTYTIPQMKSGEIVTFTYAADIDPSVLQMIDGKVITQSGNTFKAVSDGDPEGDATSITNTIDYTPGVTKSNGTLAGTDGTKQILSWTLTVNPDAKVSAAGTRVTDTIAAGSQSIMKYYGDGITVTVKDADGNHVRTDYVDWEALKGKTDSAWTYIYPLRVMQGKPIGMISPIPQRSRQKTSRRLPV